MRWLFLMLFFILPIIEIAIFVWVGSYIGAGWVVALIIITSFIGIALARQQGMETWRRGQAAIAARRMPGDEIVDGICIFLGAVFLIAPGFITDVLGLLLLLPFTRKPFRTLLKSWLAILVAKRQVFFFRKW